MFGGGHQCHPWSRLRVDHYQSLVEEQEHAFKRLLLKIK
jgi:hypothetical protein